jgi:hypothetical protein
MADNMMSEAGSAKARFYTSRINSLKELLRQSQQQQQELNALDEESVTRLFDDDIPELQQIENTSHSQAQSISKTTMPVEQGLHQILFHILLHVLSYISEIHLFIYFFISYFL